MLKGDISNELPKRILVTTDVFLNVELIVKKRLKIFPIPQVDRKIRRDILSRLYLFTTKKGVTLEAVSFDMAEEDLDLLTEMLDNVGTNPFRYFSAYSSINNLVAELPYRPEVVGVVDVPKNLLRYGHWGLDFNTI
jgi:hypothetical protein